MKRITNFNYNKEYRSNGQFQMTNGEEYLQVGGSRTLHIAQRSAGSLSTSIPNAMTEATSCNIKKGELCSPFENLLFAQLAEIAAAGVLKQLHAKLRHYRQNVVKNIRLNCLVLGPDNGVSEAVNLQRQAFRRGV